VWIAAWTVAVSWAAEDLSRGEGGRRLAKLLATFHGQSIDPHYLSRRTASSEGQRTVPQGPVQAEDREADWDQRTSVRRLMAPMPEPPSGIH
jgi:hypothetical protein